MQQILTSILTQCATKGVVKACVVIRRSRSILTPDTIIAATAIANNMILISRDMGFDKINGLRIIHPDNL